MKLLIANRGEIAIRIASAAADLGIPTVGVFSEDDARALHVRRTDQAVALPGAGPRPYLDSDLLLQAALDHGCDAVHPGYGFLSESAAFGHACQRAGVRFVGPSPEALEAFGNKARARALAERLGVPTVPGVSAAVSLETAADFLATLPEGSALLVKAVAGGGGRGIRLVSDSDRLPAAYKRARSEATAAFGKASVYVEQYLQGVRHVEVQVAADSEGSVVCFGDRDCSLQRQHQKLVEIAPAPSLTPALRRTLHDAAVNLMAQARYRNLGTVEFLVQGDLFYFIEANTRLQVEHTVTEETCGVDLVRLQLCLARGMTLAELGYGADSAVATRGTAIQVRVNMETMDSSGVPKPATGHINTFETPSGPGIRVDTFGYAGYTPSANFDSLLAKVICHSPETGTSGATRMAVRALREFRIEGLSTNLDFLLALLNSKDVAAWQVHTRYVDEHAPSLANAPSDDARFFADSAPVERDGALAGARVDAGDPLAVLAYGKTRHTRPSTAPETSSLADSATSLRATMQGTVVSIETQVGDTVAEGDVLIVMEAMKMEHEIRAPANGTVLDLAVSVHDTVFEGHVLAFLEEGDVTGPADSHGSTEDLDHVRPDLAEVHLRHEVTLDDARPDAVAKRRATGQRTARENIAQLCDAGSFVEYGQLALTPGSGLPRERIIRKFPADGMITGIGSVNGSEFTGERSKCVVLAYDYTVLAGTQGVLNHVKTDRMLELALQWRRPVVLFAEGGGGRAGTGGKRSGGSDTTAAGQGRTDDMYRPLDTPSFATMARLSGLVPLVGITSRYCFAGNASLLGCCDVIIATADSSIGMGGPALIEGGGLGVFRPEEVGPMEIQVPNGVVDLAAADESEAVALAKKYLSYFQGPVADWDCADQRRLRNCVPENRLRVYHMRDVIEILADSGSVLELRPEFGPGMITALARIEGRAVGLLANNPLYLSGAIDSDGSDKAARFMQLCDGFDIPLVVLCDTPGMMVGPEIERTALVRHCSRLFVTGANLSVPLITVILRKAYGLGAQAMAGGHTKVPVLTVAWPTAEHGGMGLEGQMKLGFRNELEAIKDPAKRKARYDELVAAAYRRGRALNAGVAFAFDDVIDPADTRHCIVRTLESMPPAPARGSKKRPFIDTW